MTSAQNERAALVETLRTVGPDAPTLCDGWTTRDLVAHLVVRERRPDTAPGILIPRFAAHTEKVRRQTAAGEWDVLLGQLADGPPVYSPMALVDRWANLAEMFVHHEDVLRGGVAPDSDWTPRALDAQLQRDLRTPAKSIGKMSLKKVPATVTLRTLDGDDLVTAGSGSPVTVTGAVGELVLFAFGRAPVNLEFSGDASAIAAVQASKRGL
ncbi:TIGR03085 family metal-binding protein [Gordonia sp. ABSL1-1]|uniref:TIGR03085 family metal-binding protein n=1 Tax=Gordonia sp. ABSL1-1 TaxID=3053923 RepID=UPI002572F6C4|nr:TIGR03085 family metal-binding protein [Gordonia sp. ABSL1-1]MDL9936340.1 TIGR03085 family metal-binding protein [Gordonia sp. ABSL1-1]